MKPRTPFQTQLRPRGGLRSRGLAVFFALGLLPPTTIPNVFHRKKDQEPREPRFTYAGGTEDVADGCVGMLQLMSSSMTYKCGERALTIPYNGIDVMQYRHDVSEQVWKMNANWKVKPPQYHIKGKGNHYFTLVYKDSGATHILVLDVPVDQMNPYLAEIELKTGRQVDVQRHDDYQ